eukprot:3586651-Pyramimonas_sp.AAC.1
MESATSGGTSRIPAVAIMKRGVRSCMSSGTYTIPSQRGQAYRDPPHKVTPIILLRFTGPPVPITARMHSKPQSSEERERGAMGDESTLAVVGTGRPVK